MNSMRWVLAAYVLLAIPAPAQQGRGTILGGVTDPSGAGIPGAAMTLTNTQTGLVFTTITTAEGLYTAPGLAIGEYTVAAEARGFKKALRRGVFLQVDQKARIDLRMELGAVTEAVEVTEEAPLVNTASATLGQVVDSKRIAELPINGRNAFALVLLSPAVKNNTGPTASGFADRWGATNLSINGGPNAMNGQTIDGGDNINPWQGETNTNPMVDSVAEFKVQTGAMSAEFGFTAGGVINLVTKSGTNSVHGTVYEFFRNDKLDARNTFAAVRPPFRYNQFGASLGGPVLKNRAFYFANWEDYHFRRGTNYFHTFPTPLQRTGDFSDLLDARGQLIPVYDPDSTRPNPAGGFLRDLFPGNRIPANRHDPVALNVQKEFIPLPNRPPLDPFTNANNYQTIGTDKRDMRQLLVRGDYAISPKNNLYGRIIHYQPEQDGGGSAWSLYPNQVAGRFDAVHTGRNVLLVDTHTFGPTVINEFRLGLNRQFWTERARSYGGGWPAKLGLPSIVPPDTLPRFNNGLQIFPIGYTQQASTAWQFFDMVTKITGKHTLKFGVDHRILRGNSIRNGNPSGNYNFPQGLTGNPQTPAGTGSAYATFLLGAVGSATITTNVGESHEGFATAGFVQDDWRVSKRLTLNLGLRYDFQKQPVERHNGYSNFAPDLINPLNGLRGPMVFAGVDGQPRSFRNEDHNDFGPRVGIAYDLRGNGKTVVRLGGGIYYPSIFFRTGFGSTAGFANTTTTYSSLQGGNYPAFPLRIGLPEPPTPPLGSKLGPSAFLGQSVTFDESDGTTPRSMQWSLSIQHELPGRWLVEAAYSANRGRHMMASEFAGYDLNQMDDAYLSEGLALQNQVPNPYAGRVPGALGAATIARSQLLRPFPYYSRIGIRSARLGNFQYDAFLLTVQRALSRGFTMLFSYTAGKKLNDGADNPTRDGEGVNENAYQNGKFNRREAWSIDPADASQRGVVSLLYELPFGPGKRLDGGSTAVNKLIGGWQINTIGTVQTGNPVVIRGADNFLANRPNSTGRSAKLDDRTRSRWFDTTRFVNPPRYTYGNVGRVLPDARNPGTVNLDLSTIKNTSLHERVSLQFRAEAFNVFNRVNLGAPNGGFVAGPDGLNRSATFGVITSARDARIVQFALKLIF
ncbi:MAG: carboxypeptidase regulatory-like domain-containing protein [Bryobacteraceae bacterium]